MGQIQTELDRTFGPLALEHALFYSREGALRFELSGGIARRKVRSNKPYVPDGGDYIDMFTRAYDRARQILLRLLTESRSLVCVLSVYGARDLRHLKRTAKKCGIAIPRSAERWDRVVRDDNPMVDPEANPQFFISFPLDRWHVDRLLWGILASEIGVRPRLWADVYIADAALGVLAHPYDHRGMDVIGPNKDLLKHLFEEFNELLLDYDRDRMQTYFGAL